MKAIVTLVFAAVCVIFLWTEYDTRARQEAARKKAATSVPSVPSKTAPQKRPEKPIAKVWTVDPVTGQLSRHNVDVTGIGSVGGSYQAPKKEYRTALDRPAY